MNASRKKLSCTLSIFVRIYVTEDGQYVHGDTRDYFLAGLEPTSPLVHKRFEGGGWYSFSAKQLDDSMSTVRVSLGTLISGYGMKNNPTLAPKLSVGAQRRLVMQSPLHTFLFDRMNDRKYGDVSVASWQLLCFLAQNTTRPEFDFNPLN